MIKILPSLFDPNKKAINQAQKVVKEVNQLEDKVAKLSDKELKDSINYFRKRLGIKEIDYDQLLYSLDSYQTQDKALKEERERLLAILPEVFARVREAAKRVANHRHFDVQLTAGLFLVQNKVTEVYTGEGKTNVAMLASFLYGLSGRGVHVVTVNDYLARRDGEWVGHVLGALGMKVGIITPQGSFIYVSDKEALKLKGKKVQKELDKKDLTDMSSLSGSNLFSVSKQEAYKADITYGQANEFGFDYLRDNMAVTLSQRVQRGYYYTIVDEADSILIDEARTPLIISSAPDQTQEELYYKFAKLAQQLEQEKDYTVDEKARSVILTEQGIKKVEDYLNDEKVWENYLYVHHLDNALKAKALFQKDKEYLVKGNEILIVDEFTGRVLQGRRYSEGLHQAIEAKESVPIKQETKTMATVSFQNYFRRYPFLAGMTGTAMTEAEEFNKIYNIDVVQVPTYKPIVRKDNSDVIYKTTKAKFEAAAKEIEDLYKKGQPVLVGTTSVEKSEYLSTLLTQKGVPHEVLNAKQHEKEGKIVAKAGKAKKVTVATNMAGRGVDIKLRKGVKDLGGLFVLGTERHEARRIDNQLRGRSGRLGDPGASRFYVSLEDDLMRIFGGDVIKNFFSRSGLPEDVPIESKMITRALESAQKKVESSNFSIRKRLVEYDDVLNQQRDTVYDLRRRLLVLLNQQREAIKDRKVKENKIDPAKIDIEELVKDLDGLSLLDSDSWFYLQDKVPSPLNSALGLWVLKQVFAQIQLRISSNLSGQVSLDDNQNTPLNSEDSDKEDETKELLAKAESGFDPIFSYLDAILPQELQEESLKKLGYKSVAELKLKIKKQIKEKKRDVREAFNPVFQILLIAAVDHLQRLPNPEVVVDLERLVILQPLDNLWTDHIDAMADLRDGVGLRGYAQKDPLVEYKKEGASMFENFFVNLSNEITTRFYRVRVVAAPQPTEDQNLRTNLNEIDQELETGVNVTRLGQKSEDQSPDQTKPDKETSQATLATPEEEGDIVKRMLQDAVVQATEVSKTPRKVVKKVGRNEPCPCGSGKKYKKCCYPKYG